MSGSTSARSPSSGRGAMHLPVVHTALAQSAPAAHASSVLHGRDAPSPQTLPEAFAEPPAAFGEPDAAAPPAPASAGSCVAGSAPFATSPPELLQASPRTPKRATTSDVRRAIARVLQAA